MNKPAPTYRVQIAGPNFEATYWQPPTAEDGSLDSADLGYAIGGAIEMVASSVSKHGLILANAVTYVAESGYVDISHRHGSAALRQAEGAFYEAAADLVAAWYQYLERPMQQNVEEGKTDAT